MSAASIYGPRGLSGVDQFERADELVRIFNRPGIHLRHARDLAAWVVLNIDNPASQVAKEAQALLERLRLGDAALEFAAGNTTTEKVLDLARDLEAALTAYELKETAA